MKLWISAVALIMLCASPVLAQNILRVPEDFATIQAAAIAANPSGGDTILIGPGTYCGANIAKRLTILGEGQPTIAPIESCTTQTVGLWLWPNASGTIIQYLNFSDLTTGIVALGAKNVTIEHNSFSAVTTGIAASNFGASIPNDVIVEHNTMQLTGTNPVGIDAKGAGSDWIVSHNTISTEYPNGRGIVNFLGNGWTVSHNKLTGTGLKLGIWFNRIIVLPVERSVNNTAKFNHIEGANDGLGIKVTGQYGAVVRDNDIFMPSSSDHPLGVCGGWGIEVSDSRVIWPDQGLENTLLTSINSLITNNDTRGTAVGVIVAEDRFGDGIGNSGGIGNSVGNILRGNFGTYAIHQPDSLPDNPCSSGEITGEVKNRAKSSLIACGDDGICEGLPEP